MTCIYQELEKYKSYRKINVIIAVGDGGLGGGRPPPPPFGLKRQKLGQIVFYLGTQSETKQIKSNDLLTRNL